MGEHDLVDGGVDGDEDDAGNESDDAGDEFYDGGELHALLCVETGPEKNGN